MTTQTYAVIASVAGTYYGEVATVGQVVNSVLWDGDTATWAPPAGTETRADPDGLLAIGTTTTV